MGVFRAKVEVCNGLGSFSQRMRGNLDFSFVTMSAAKTMLQHSSRAQEETVVMYRRRVWKSFYYLFFLFLTKIFICLFIYLFKSMNRKKKAFIEFMKGSWPESPQPPSHDSVRAPVRLPEPRRTLQRPDARDQVRVHAGLQRSCFMCTCTDGEFCTEQVRLLSFTLSSIISHGWST